MRNDVERLVTVLVSHLSKEQLHAILQAITDAYEYGSCPLCGCDEMPVDKQGREIEGEDVSHASEWREEHDDDCAVTLIEKSFSKKKKVAS